MSSKSSARSATARKGPAKLPAQKGAQQARNGSGGAQSTAEWKAAEEAKRAARMERQAAAQAAAQRRKKTQMVRNIGIAVVALLLVAGGLTAYAMNEANKPGQSVPMQPSPHLASVDSPHAPYTTDPPTSGPHVPQLPSWGVSATPVPVPLQVHALEDAGVVINYKPGTDQATIDKLAALARSYDTEVLMSPYPGLSNPIVLTAWTRIDRLDTFDEARIRKFIDAYRGIDHHKDSGS